MDAQTLAAKLRTLADGLETGRGLGSDLIREVTAEMVTLDCAINHTIPPSVAMNALLKSLPKEGP